MFYKSQNSLSKQNKGVLVKLYELCSEKSRCRIVHPGRISRRRFICSASVEEGQCHARMLPRSITNRCQVPPERRGRIVNCKEGVAQPLVPVVLTVICKGTQLVAKDIIDAFRLGIGVLVIRRPHDLAGTNASRERLNDVLMNLGS